MGKSSVCVYPHCWEAFSEAGMSSFINIGDHRVQGALGSIPARLSDYQKQEQNTDHMKGMVWSLMFDSPR
jgi:hypothetical protein